MHKRNILTCSLTTSYRCFAGITIAALFAACATLSPTQQQPPPPQPSAPGSSAPSASSPAQRPLPNINLSGYSPTFKEAFRDGCDSFRGSYRRDNNRFGKDNDYTIGWQDGFSICRRQGK